MGSTQQGQQKLDRAFDRLEAETPERTSRFIEWLRRPAARWVRIPLGIVLVVAGFFGFLPVLGFEFIPLGLLLLAIDVPFLREPIGKAVLWLEDKWDELKAWWHRRRQRAQD